VQDNSASGVGPTSPQHEMPSCGHENPESAVHCTDCRVPLHPSIDDRTMDGPPDATTREASQPSRAESNTNVSSMVRTPSGHSPSQSRSSSGGSGGRSRVLEPGDELGPRFRINPLLGEGGMGRVYKATDLELGREIAIKVLLSELTSDPQVIQRFKSELLLASRISHRNILRMHDLSEADGVKFITMAYVEGKDLNQLLKTNHPARSMMTDIRRM